MTIGPNRTTMPAEVAGLMRMRSLMYGQVPSLQQGTGGLVIHPAPAGDDGSSGAKALTEDSSPINESLEVSMTGCTRAVSAVRPRGGLVLRSQHHSQLSVLTCEHALRDGVTARRRGRGAAASADGRG